MNNGYMEKYIFKDGKELPYISSRQNPRVSAAAKLADKKYREKSRSFLCEGVKLTLEAARWGVLLEVYVRESSAEELRGAVDAAEAAGSALWVLSDPAFDKITTERSPQGIISVAAFGDTSDNEVLSDGGMILFLDSVRDPGNLGTILRSACALGGAGVVLHSCADVYNTKTVRAAMGAIFKTDITLVDDGVEYIRRCKKCGRRVLAAALSDESMILGEYAAESRDVIVIGNEGHGISRQLLAECDGTVLIPMEENTESLNASVAASVILWEYARSKHKNH